MRNTFTKVYAILAIMLVSTLGFSQGIVKGIAWDGDMKEAMVGANVVVKGTMNGVTSNFNGSFELSLPAGDAVLEFSFMGYATLDVPVSVKDGETVSLGRVTMASDAVGLQEIQLIADVAIARKTPVAVSTVTALQIQENLGSQEFPEIMKTTPGVYTTKQGGGLGDSRINIRGFSQENIAVMINGIPVNDMENGRVYWSNWAGLSDATRSVQIQRGLGASKLAINSVGGTMNILTKPSESKPGGFAEIAATEYGMFRAKVGVSTGLLESGTAVTAIIGTTQGNGYIEETWAKAYSYFITVSQKLGDKHTLLFTASGAPQKHGQRPYGKYNMFTYDQYENSETSGVDRKYNANWGYLKGERISEKENFYHKPQLGLNWFWSINDATKLSTVAYASFGTGGGSGTLGQRPSNSNPSTGERQGWDDLYAANVANGQSKGLLRNSMNNHKWVGLLSTLSHSFNDNLKLMGGLDGRYYKGEHYREVKDLLGGTGYNDSKHVGLGGDNLQVGDKVAYNNEASVGYIGAFAQLEYSNDIFSTFITGTVSNTTYNRTDYMNYGIAKNGESMYYKDIKKQDGTAYGDIKRVAADADAVSNLGYTFKVGANYNINDQFNVFANTGYYSRAPFIQAVYLNYKNDVNPDLKNESIIGAELGVGYHAEKFAAKVNMYYTKWQDRFLRTGYQDDKGDYYTVNFTNLAETHTGIEIEINYKVLPSMDLGVFGSFGNWVYANDPTTDVLDDNQDVIAKDVIVALDGLKVADAPQTQIGLTWNYRFLDGFSAGANFLYFNNYYSAFDTKSRIVKSGQTPDRDQSFQIPSYTTLDLRVGYKFQLAGLEWKANINAYNVLDTVYMAEGLDSVNKFDSNGDGNKTYGHGKENFKGFMGWGRNFNFSLRVSF